jgi:hypothetical protein
MDPTQESPSAVPAPAPEQQSTSFESVTPRLDPTPPVEVSTAPAFEPTVSAPAVEPMPSEPIVPPPAPEIEPSTGPTPTDTVDPLAQPAPLVSEADPVIDTPQVVATGAFPAAPQANNPGKVIGIVGFVFCFVGLAFPGIILGVIGLNKSKKAGQKNGLAFAAIILGAIVTLLALAAIAISIAFLSTHGATVTTSTPSSTTTTTTINTTPVAVPSSK